ncbi:MAG: RtcB family protein [Balneolaceae bacterium]|nr:RtcB family protein [Balneolaceae bacterium]
MIEFNHLEQKTDFLWEIPTSYRDDMRVPAWVYATREALEEILQDDSLNQLVNVSTLPGIQKAAIAMPDAHQGYGFPIGGVAATEYPDGVISPGGIGYDINCGVRLLRSGSSFDEVKEKLEQLSKELYNLIPTGAGKSGPLHLRQTELEELLEEGAQWTVNAGYGKTEDLEYIESNGKYDDADAGAVSHKAKQRGNDQVGTLGGGNHFMEVDRIDEIYDEEAARAMNLHKGQIVFMIHTGSRGLGHQVATENVNSFLDNLGEYGISLPDRGLACAPLSSSDGQRYYKAMGASANFAWANRQMITHQVRKAWGNVIGGDGSDIDVVYDIAHNMAKIEDHRVNGDSKTMIVHRKGATRAFGPNHPVLPNRYKPIGQPVLIPGSMGTSSYILAGTAEGMEETFGSTCHGAGRRMSRTSAKKQVNADQLRKELKQQGIYLQAASRSGVAEEAPLAYKDVSIVVDTVEKAGIAKKVAMMKPVAVIKG